MGFIIGDNLILSKDQTFFVINRDSGRILTPRSITKLHDLIKKDPWKSDYFFTTFTFTRSYYRNVRKRFLTTFLCCILVFYKRDYESCKDIFHEERLFLNRCMRFNLGWKGSGLCRFSPLSYNIVCNSFCVELMFSSDESFKSLPSVVLLETNFFIFGPEVGVFKTKSCSSHLGSLDLKLFVETTKITSTMNLVVNSSW